VYTGSVAVGLVQVACGRRQSSSSEKFKLSHPNVKRSRLEARRLVGQVKIDKKKQLEKTKKQLLEKKTNKTNSKTKKDCGEDDMNASENNKLKRGRSNEEKTSDNRRHSKRTKTNK